jgi:rhamnose utilization protein RhaD (predicted bifunctional aldolase and dehydrogenase)
MRPSVETILHAMFPYAYVVHLHPALVNGVLCSVRAEKSIRELFGDDVLYVPYTTPGYILSKTLSDSFETWTKQGRRFPSIVFLQNHGIFVAADSVQEIDKIYSMVFDRIASRIVKIPDFSTSGKNVDALMRKADDMKTALMAAAAGYLETPSIEFQTNNEILRYADSAEDFARLNGAFSPDHIVYAGARPLYVPCKILEGNDSETDKAQSPDVTNRTKAVLAKQIGAYIAQEGTYPHVVVVEKLGAFGLAKNDKAAQLALLLFKDAIKVSVYSMSFGGPHFMEPADVDFIKKWEVEQYRSTVSA